MEVQMLHVISLEMCFFPHNLSGLAMGLLGLNKCCIFNFMEQFSEKGLVGVATLS